MTPHGSVLALSLALAASPHAVAGPAVADTAPLLNGGEFGAGTHRLSASVIEHGDFVRTADGVESASIEISGRDGLIIDGGTFRTAHPVALAHGVELGRGKSISLYNKIHPDPTGAAASGATTGGGYQLFTPTQVRQIFASGDQARIREAFTSADAKGVAPEPLTETAVLTALSAANNVLRARTQLAWQLTADSGDLVVNGGEFDFDSVNRNRIAAGEGKLIWTAGDLTSRGGGGETALQGTAGIELLGGSLSSFGAADGVASPIYYDPRQRLDRDRWTLGNYLVLVTDGDITIGRAGKPGPDIRMSDGMLQIARASRPATEDAAKPPTQHVNLLSGSISLHGEQRSTLLALGADMVTLVNGGTLNVSNSQTLIDTPTESPSMWNMQTVLEDGTINLDNGQLIGADSAINGGVVNLTGLSAIYSPMGALKISAGSINVGPQSFIGAIKGDSKARSPYPTAQHDLVISGGTLNFRVVAPPPGEPLVVGVHIGGIFAGDNNPARQSDPTLTIGTGTRINVDTGTLPAGKYGVAGFASVDAGDGTLAIDAAVPVYGSAGTIIGSLDTDGSLALQLK